MDPVTIHLPNPRLRLPTGHILRIQVAKVKVMDSFVIRRGRVFPMVQDSEEYLLFLNNSNPNIVIVIAAPTGTRPAVYPINAWLPLRTHWGYGNGSTAYDKGYPITVMVVVVFVVIVVVPVPEVDLVRRL